MTFLTTILPALLIFGVIIFFHELGHLLAAKAAGVTVYEFAVGMGPALLKKEWRGTVYSLRLLPVGGFTMLEGEEEAAPGPGSLSNKPLGSKIAVFMAGAVFNLVLGYLILTLLTAINGYVGTTSVAAFNEGATSQGTLLLGDKITRVNGHSVRTSNDITYEFLRDVDGLVELTVQREGATMLLPIQFQMTDLGEGVQAINLDFKVAAVPARWYDYLVYPVNWGISIVKQVWGSLIDLMTGRYAVNQLSGPVGVVNAIGQATKMGLRSLLLMAAFITINLGVLNLFPFPILDGGKVVLSLIESIIRRPINRRLLDALMTGSAALLIALMLYVTYNDVFRLVVR